jgi:hypothetical protein
LDPLIWDQGTNVEIYEMLGAEDEE